MISNNLTMSWKYKGNYITELADMPENVFGFIYKITNTQTGEYYIGKKEAALITDKRMKKYEMVTKESDWKLYRSSNVTVKKWFDDAKISSNCTLEILRFCLNAKSLTYYELQEQFSHNVLADELALNDNLLGKFFRKDLE